MKKHLIAAGVVAAFAAPAMAQNVSVYGIVDVNYSTVDYDNAGSESAMGSSALATSRLGLRGSEDLGGGLKAEFQLEGTLIPQDGQIGKPTTKQNTYTTATGTAQYTTTNDMFDREAWAGVSGAFGAVRFGRTDVTSAVNIDAKVSQIGDLGLISELSTDQKKSIRYTSPNFQGFQVEVGYANPDAKTSSGGETTAKSLTNIYASYEKGPLGVYLARESQKVTQSLDQDQTTFGAKYDFGVVSVGLTYSTRDNVKYVAKDGDIAAKYDAEVGGKDLKQTVLSAAMPLANGYKLHAAYEKADLDSNATGGTTNDLDFDSYTLAVTKSLSKRTSLYAAFISTDKELTTANDSKQYTVGIVHNF